MTKEGRVPSFLSTCSAASPYSSSYKTSEKSKLENLVQSVWGEKDWEEAKCPICMETPHNAVLLLCSNHEKGCRPYICNTSNRHSNCLDQFLKSSPSKPTLSCPLCRGKIKEWIVIELVRNFMDSVPRNCSVESCEFTGTYAELEKHASLDHPSAMPTQAEPVRQHALFTLELRSYLQDMNLMVLNSDFENGFAQMARQDVEEMYISNGSRVSRPSRNRTARISVGGYFSRHQLASRTDDRPSRNRRTARMSVCGYFPRHQLASRADDATN